MNPFNGIESYAQGKMSPVTTIFRLEEVNEVFEALRGGKILGRALESCIWISFKFIRFCVVFFVEEKNC